MLSKNLLKGFCFDSGISMELKLILVQDILILKQVTANHR